MTALGYRLPVARLLAEEEGLELEDVKDKNRCKFLDASNKQ